MIKSLLPLAVLGTALFGFASCKNDSYKKTKDGLEYRIIKDAKGDKKPAVGDVVAMHVIIRYKDDKTDTTLFESRKMMNNQPVELQLTPSPFKGDWMDGIMMMTAGDSASFRVAIDSLRKSAGGELPPFMKNGQKLEYTVVLASVKTQAQVMEEQQASSGKQKEVDNKLIQDYLSQNSIVAQKTASGLYYVIEKEGSGSTPTQGQKVSVNYTGRTLDGTPFDSNVDPKFQHTEPFEFELGRGMVIPGWDEGVALLKKGTKAKLFVPSPLAYGPQGTGPIPPNAVLMFDVELLDIK
jgi:FKBP-type peptidyl-prolyl cis-trans isomerase